jgi:hypothetical protein
MADDGSGGAVYVKAVNGVPHVFACLFSEGAWSQPLRVDWDLPYGAGQPAIAAGPGGELLVVWVTAVATVHGQVQDGLYSARLGAGAGGFGPSLLVDPNVGEGVGVDPSVSGTAPGKAIVAYRAITYTFNDNGFSPAVQLRPGDVMADIRIARLNGDRWSRMGAINRNPEASMRPPSPTNGPLVGAGTDGGAVVAWQEPDQTGTARIWMRRVFSSGLGAVLEASPASLEGAPVSGDADAFSLAVTPFDQARVAIRIAGLGPSPPRLLLNTLPPDFAVPSGVPNGPLAVFSSGGAPLGAPGVSATEKGGGSEGSMRLGFTAGADVRQVGVNAAGGLEPLPAAPGPAAEPGAESVTAVGPEGGGVLAYPARDAQGRPAVAVRQELPSGAAQVGLLAGTASGPVGALSIGPSPGGDALIGFRQGEAGHYEIVAERVSEPPASFKAKAPKGWVRPARARLRWQASASAVPGLTYSVVLEGRVVKSDLTGLSYRPRPALLGSGVRRLQAMAVDGLGQQVLSPEVRLRVDAQPPRVVFRAGRSGSKVAVRLSDPDSGLRGARCAVEFGDGAEARGGHVFHHAYRRPGRYEVVVRAADKAGNRVTRRFEAVVR